jgi:hypothetical protein
MASKTRFLSEVKKRIADGKTRRLFSKDEIQSMTSRWNALSNKISKKESPADYRLLKEYLVITVDGRCLLAKSQGSNPEEVDMDTIETYVSIEDMHDILLEIHVETGHGGRDRMLHRVKNRKLANIT